jgi:myo-inositol 2-dehydrogenase/D-chiro-inositol 1-dehydrogenase
MTTRRDFITTSGAALGAAVAASPILRAQDANTEFRVGVVGCGGRGSGAADQNLSVTGPNVKLVAIADMSQGRIKGAVNDLKNKHGIKVDVPDERQFVGFDGYEKIMAMPDVNVVILATPPGFRPFHFEAAVKAGKHVFMEKPVCVDSFGANMVMAAAKEADAKNLKVVVGLQRRYEVQYIETYKQVQAGLIGDIVRAEVYWNGDRPWVRDREDGDTEMAYQLRNWYHFNWLCGDNICEQHIHNIDVANWFMGDKHPVRARGMGGCEVLTGKRYGEIFDHHSVEFIYDNGVIVHSMCEHVPNTWSKVS